MKTLIAAACVAAMLAGCAASGPPTAWGKPGVSRIDYGTDIGLCSGRAVQVGAGAGYRTAGGVQGSNNTPVMERDTRGTVLPRGPTDPQPAGTAATSAQLPANGMYSGVVSSDFAQRAATQQRTQEMAQKRAQAEAFRSCLLERGYTEFDLTPEQRAHLGTLKTGSNEYHEYLYSLGKAPPAQGTR
jgi:hypothetical protein